MDYQRFNVPSDIDVYAEGQVDEYIDAARKHYTDRYPYHNWNHATSVIEGVDIIANKLAERNVTIARDTLRIAAAWHDAGYHQNHSALGFSTKEDYSADLLMKFVEAKPVTSIQKQLMRTAIVATWHLHPELRTPPQMILHRADTANIGGPSGSFVENNLLLWDESRLRNRGLTWEQHVAQTNGFVQLLVAEHDHESLLQKVQPDDPTIDVYDEPFREAAFRNLDVLQGVSEPKKY